MEYPVDSNTLFYARFPKLTDLSLSGIPTPTFNSPKHYYNRIEPQMRGSIEFFNGFMTYPSPMTNINVNNNDYTLEIWLYLRTPLTYHTIFSKSLGGTNRFYFDSPNVNYYNHLCNVGGALITSMRTANNTAIYDRLHHIVFICQRNVSNFFYRDLSPLALTINTTNLGLIQFSSPLYIGAYIATSVTLFDGLIYEVRLSNKVRTMNELEIFHAHTRKHINKNIPHLSELM